MYRICSPDIFRVDYPPSQRQQGCKILVHEFHVTWASIAVWVNDAEHPYPREKRHCSDFPFFHLFIQVPPNGDPLAAFALGANAPVETARMKLEHPAHPAHEKRGLMQLNKALP
jgi:hypothetical protein